MVAAFMRATLNFEYASVFWLFYVLKSESEAGKTDGAHKRIRFMRLSHFNALD